MASGEVYLGSSKNIEAKAVWSSTSNGSAKNSSKVAVNVYVRRPDGYTTKGTWGWSVAIRGEVEAGTYYGDVFGAYWILLGSYYINEVPHASNGTGECWVGGSVTGPTGTSQEGAYINGGAIVKLDTIPRYASINHSLNSTGLNNIKVNWSSDSTCDLVQYSLNGGSWVTTSGNPYNISGLSPNTTYKIRTRVRRKDSQLYSNTGELSATTKDIGRISSLSSFQHGSSTTIGITNPSGASLKLVMKIGTTQIFSRTVTTSTKTIGFSDTELDNIYKRYGTSSSLTASFTLTTAGSYTNTKTCTITLKGNQKTAKRKISGVWRRACVWRKVSGTWRRCVVWRKISGTWRRCI